MPDAVPRWARGFCAKLRGLCDVGVDPNPFLVLSLAQHGLSLICSLPSFSRDIDFVDMFCGVAGVGKAMLQK
eukprot:4413354-Alexandrium_andersonii.AAC.1